MNSLGENDASRSESTGVDRNLTSYGDAGFSSYIRRAFLSSAGFDDEDLDRPIVGIIDTSSDYTTCHRDMPQLVAAVKRGVLEAGGLPLACPTLSLGEILISPTAMLFRNLLAMSTEEAIRGYPMDAVVLVGGCDKTVPAQLMAAASANVPAISLVVGPMRSGHWRGERLGACTDCRGFWTRHRGGELSDDEIVDVRSELCPTGGTCMVMGTASTMACVTETLGMMLPGGATAPSGSGDRLRQAVATGRRAVGLYRENLRPSDILTREAFENALRVLSALSGSTNAVLHLLAIAGRAGVELDLDDFDRIAREIPLLVDCKPAGANWLEDLHAAGGVPAVLRALATALESTTRGVSGRKLAELLSQTDPPAEWQDIVHTLAAPLGDPGTLAVLRGSLAPDGAVIKAAAATRALWKHRGPTVVFESPEDAAARLDDPALGITAEHVLVLRNAGPVASGMPEAGSLPIPRHLAAQGVRDMVRVSDGRMSGTAYGTVVLHCSPEAATGGPLALVEDGDIVELDVESRRIDLLVDDETLAKRRLNWSPPPKPSRGWRRLYAEQVQPPHLGADMEFLVHE